MYARPRPVEEIYIIKMFGYFLCCLKVVLVIYCCIKNITPKLSSLKQQTLIFHSFCVSEIWCA